MFLNICFFYSRIKKVIVIIKKNELNKIFRCFVLSKEKKNENPEAPEIIFSFVKQKIPMDNIYNY